MYKPIIASNQSQKPGFSETNKMDEDKMSPSEEDIASRCETVLNTTMAELEVYHTQKIQGFEDVMKSHLDGEIAFYEKVILFIIYKA